MLIGSDYQTGRLRIKYSDLDEAKARYFYSRKLSFNSVWFCAIWGRSQIFRSYEPWIGNRLRRQSTGCFIWCAFFIWFAIESVMLFFSQRISHSAVALHGIHLYPVLYLKSRCLSGARSRTRACIPQVSLSFQRRWPIRNRRFGGGSTVWLSHRPHRSKKPACLKIWDRRISPPELQSI